MSIQSIDIDWADSSFDAIKILQDMILQKSQPKINNKYKIPLDLIRNAVVISAGICISVIPYYSRVNGEICRLHFSAFLYVSTGVILYQNPNSIPFDVRSRSVPLVFQKISSWNRNPPCRHQNPRLFHRSSILVKKICRR
jgi:hypothetical protein